jgi:hypothetical protein
MPEEVIGPGVPKYTENEGNCSKNTSPNQTHVIRTHNPKHLYYRDLDSEAQLRRLTPCKPDF